MATQHVAGKKEDHLRQSFRKISSRQLQPRGFDANVVVGMAYVLLIRVFFVCTPATVSILFSSHSFSI